MATPTTDPSADPTADSRAETVADHPVVLFDGVCGLCNGFVDWVIKRDERGTLRFAPLQGETARALVGELTGDPDLWSVFLVDADGTHDRSDAVLRILARLGGVWRASAVLRIFPRGLRDFVYRGIARRRYRWFEKRATCRMPTEADRGRMLE